MEANILNEFFKTFGAELSERRRRRRLSQADLANEAGINRTYVSDVENGKRNFSIATLYALAKSLDVTMAELVDQVDQPAETGVNPRRTDKAEEAGIDNSIGNFDFKLS